MVFNQNPEKRAERRSEPDGWLPFEVDTALRFHRNGVFRVGLREQLLPLGTPLLAFMKWLITGWVKWEFGREDEMISTSLQLGFVIHGYKPLPRELLGDTNSTLWDYHDQDPWSEIVILPFGDPTNGNVFNFIGTTAPEVDAVCDLAGVYDKHLRTHPQELPLVKLSTKWWCRSGLRIHRPIFDVIGWGRPKHEGVCPPPPNAPTECVH